MVSALGATLASMIACRSDSMPLSCPRMSVVVLTVKVAGTQRSSSISSAGRKRFAGRRLGETVRLRSHEENHMLHLLSGAGLRYSEKATVPGAQTERRGETWVIEELAWRQNLTGRCCRI